MIFNSIDFAVFLPLVFFFYWFVTNRNLKLQNLLIVAASYLFYGWWDYRFLSLILISTIIDYLVGKNLATTESQHKRKILLWCSIVANLGLLGFFKYYNFFVDNFTAAFSFFGTQITSSRLDIILPAGISFYTFQTMSYTIDIYKKKLSPTKDFVAFSAFVCFFPQLIAGPIERATNLLPQFSNKRNFDYSKAVDGMRQILWGLFKKVVIADNCAEYANIIFNHSADYSGSTLVFGAIFFAFQIYGDFSGYSDIAIGTSRLFGFELKQNFRFPYFARDIAEFWRRWHISLSTWFRDYLYIPLGGSRGGNWLKLRNMFIIFIVSGFWHGANWTFIVWGLINAIYFVPLLLGNKNRKNMEIVAAGRFLPSLKEFSLIVLTFTLTTISWIFFRSNDIGQALQYITDIFSSSIISPPYVIETATGLPIFPKTVLLLLIIFIIVEWVGRESEHALAHVRFIKIKTVRYITYIAIIFSIFWFRGEEQMFIYFQF